MIDFSFCIITDNSDAACERILHIAKSISDLNIPNYEILIIGGETNRFTENLSKFNMRKINFDESAKRAWITKKKNDVAKMAKYENLVMMHDYFVFHASWYKHYSEFLKDKEYDICCNPILLIDRRRDYTDWTTYDHPIYGKQCPLPYSDWTCTKNQYISGGYFLTKKQFFLDNPLNEELVSHQEEDVEWSLRVRDSAKIICNPRSYVIHNKKHRNMTVDIWRQVR